VTPDFQQESLSGSSATTSSAQVGRPKITGNTVVITGGSQVDLYSFNRSTDRELLVRQVVRRLIIKIAFHS
jgi:hypothetical protein